MSDRMQQAQASAGSATVVETPPPAQAATDAPVYTLQLQPRVRVTFDESVVDNEHLGRKKSNKCCIFHKKREFGESSSESGEDSSDDDDGRARRPQHKHRRGCKHNGHPHEHKADNDNDSSKAEQASD